MSSIFEINERYKRCPLCQSDLKLIVKTTNAILNYSNESNNISISKSISGWKMSPKSYTYNIKVLIDIKTNEFSIDFKDNDGKSLSHITKTHMNNYMDFYNNKVTERLFFTKRCLDCNGFYCITGLVSLNHKNSTLYPIEISSEYYLLYRKDKNKYYYLCNRLGSMITSLDVKRADYQPVIDYWENTGSYISLPLLNLNLSDMKKVYQKLDMMLLFS